MVGAKIGHSQFLHGEIMDAALTKDIGARMNTAWRQMCKTNGGHHQVRDPEVRMNRHGKKIQQKQ